jgi:hypothetical protein
MPGPALLGALATAAVLVTSTAACSSGSDADEGAERPSTTTSEGSSGDVGSPSSSARPPAASTTSAPSTAPPAQAGDWWRPAKGLSWQWQLDGEPIDVSVDAEVFDVDLFETPAATVRTLHERGRKVICYLSAGSWEPYRPDATAFPASLKGGAVEGWPDERWLDIRRLDVLGPLMAARFDICRAKGFDGIEPDWLDSFQQDTGFPISRDDQLRFNRMLADLAHERGLAIGLKNDLDQVADLADLYDFAVVEQCAEFSECEMLRPFLDRGKPVFHAEYDLPTSAFCAESRRLGLSSIRKRLDLDAWREVCS